MIVALAPATSSRCPSMPVVGESGESDEPTQRPEGQPTDFSAVLLLLSPQKSETSQAAEAASGAGDLPPLPGQAEDAKKPSHQAPDMVAVTVNILTPPPRNAQPPETARFGPALDPA